MTHDEAKKSMAAEAYILDDLEPAERSAFEEHFFDCTACTADVLDAASVADGVRTETTNVVPFPDHYTRWAAAAAAVFAALLGYESLVVVPRMAANHDAHVQNTRVLTSQPQQLNAESRGPSSVAVVLVRPDEPVLLEVPFAATTRGPHRGEILDMHGRKNGESFDVPDNGDVVPLFVPAGTLKSGNYTLVIRGDGGQEDSRYRFEVRSR